MLFRSDKVSAIVLGHVGDSDGIEGVGDCEDSRAQWDEGPSDAVGVARSVPSLVMMGDENRGFLQEEKRLKQVGSEPGMVLNRDLGFRVKDVVVCDPVRWEHQDADVVEQGGQFELMQRIGGESHSLSERQGNGSGSLPVAYLPGKSAVDLFADLAHQNAFDVAACRIGRPQMIRFAK